MKKLFICFTFFYLNLLLIKAQEFSGAINFKYATVYDTTLNVYYVKNHLVRLDQFARKKNIVEGSFIFNLKSNEVQCINPKRKLWAPQKNTSPQIIKGECIVTKGNKTKIIALKLALNSYTAPTRGSPGTGKSPGQGPGYFLRTVVYRSCP